jgi:hypothetical protein
VVQAVPTCHGEGPYRQPGHNAGTCPFSPRFHAVISTDNPGIAHFAGRFIGVAAFRMMVDGMASDIRYVVKATTRGGRVCWLTEAGLGGKRTFAERELAERFETTSHTAEAIRVMKSKENCRGIVFTIEAADQSEDMPSL